ncbi:helix-turn-helix transcriptional regulator [Baekduia sp.]|uniref:helix-turn-helix domain-containing protein n=1 Tax=Baekduia sp. TaxID=2600305 RepID=UPI002D768161|nr:helix-turn-helix transcriptional regulator [Baekduia sp.]
MPGGWAYIELRHLDPDEIKALKDAPPPTAVVIAPRPGSSGIDPLRQFAANVRTRRKALDLTQEIVADRAGMHASYWGRIERGKIDPGVRTIARVAAALESTPVALMAGVGANRDPDLRSRTRESRRSSRSRAVPSGGRPARSTRPHE